MATHALITGPVTAAIRATEREHDPHRRLALAALAAVPFLPRPALAAGRPDAALFALEAPILAALAARAPLSDAHNAADWLAMREPTEENKRARDETGAAYDAADDRVLELTRDLADLRATTLAGIVLKARMIRNDGDDQALSESIVEDLLAMGGEA